MNRGNEVQSTKLSHSTAHMFFRLVAAVDEGGPSSFGGPSKTSSCSFETDREWLPGQFQYVSSVSNISMKSLSYPPNPSRADYFEILVAGGIVRKSALTGCNVQVSQ